MNTPESVSADSFTGLREECGVFAAYDGEGKDMAPLICRGLSALQHRGQESCGIALSSASGPLKDIRCHKGLGLVSEVFSPSVLQNLPGNPGVGHVRYSTCGASSPENAQPLVRNDVEEAFALAHNGNLVNAFRLRREQEQAGAVFRTAVDSEVIACGIAGERSRASSMEEAVEHAARSLMGGYALAVASPGKLIGVRDPWGLKPLCLGKKDASYFLSSESCAFSSLGIRFIRDLLPGEILTITSQGLSSRFLPSMPVKTAHCAFEYIYFARLDSVIDGVSVYDARFRSGEALARLHPAQADLVTGVPDSGLTAAAGFSKASSIPFALAFCKNSYVGRTFIKPTDEERQNAVRMKLSVLPSVVKEKNIVLVDDSLVRGTTMSALVKMLRQAGAAQIHVRISSPPFLFPCYFGTDVPSNRQLIASSHSEEDICALIGADSLAYLPIEALDHMTEGLSLCKACFDGHYPMPVPDCGLQDEQKQGES